MNIEHQDLSDSLRRVTLSGRMDIAGADAIGTRFTALTTAAGRHVVVDMTGVDFLASIGIRSLISNAKALHQRGGRMVLLVNADDSVRKTLETTGVDALIPMFSDPAAALAAAEA